MTAVLRAFEPSPVPARNIPNSELKVEGEGVQKGLDPQQVGGVRLLASLYLDSGPSLCACRL